MSKGGGGSTGALWWGFDREPGSSVEWLWLTVNDNGKGLGSVSNNNSFITFVFVEIEFVLFSNSILSMMCDQILSELFYQNNVYISKPMS